MQIRGKLFPYPILNHNNAFSNYLSDKYFDLVFIDESTDENTIVKDISFRTNSETFKNLILEGAVKVAVILECPNVVLRRIYDISDRKIDLVLSNQELSGKVELSMFAYATKDFCYSPKEVDEDYQGIDFQIDKYDIIGVNDGVSMTVVHKESEDSLVKSIFSIQMNNNIEDGIFEIQYENSRKILISMSENDYKNYNVVYSMPDYQEVFFNMMLIPTLSQALTDCFNRIKNNDLIDDVLLTYQWFASIQKQYQRLTGNELTSEIIETIQQPISFAQFIMGKPMKNALKKLIEASKQIIKVEED